MVSQTKIISWTIIFLLCLDLTLAIGIRPAKTEIISETTPIYSGNFWVVNNDQRDFFVRLYVEGEMRQYVTLSRSELNFKEDDDARSVDFTVNLPATVPPGKSSAEIIIEEVLEQRGANQISAKILLKHKILIQGPYPDKYIETKLNFQDAGEEIRLVSEVQNLGKKDLEEVQTKFYVNDKLQQQHVLETETSSLKTSEDKLLTATLEKKVLERGEFEVLAVTKYDDQKVELVKKLVVGSPSVEITYFDPYFIANKINQYSMDLLNQWNTKVENVFVDVDIKRDGRKIDSFRTRSVDIDSSVTKRINDYFDARNKNPGQYSFEMAVNFWNTYKMDKKVFSSELIPEGEAEKVMSDASGKSNLAGGAIASGGEEAGTLGSALVILLWVLLGALLGAVIFYVLWRFTHREEYEGGEKGVL